MENGKTERQKFVKAERLRHKRLVEDLFSQGETLYDFPLRLSYRMISREELEKSFRGGLPSRIAKVQMMVTVPKKKRRHAVDRVLLRRRIREAYRLQKEALLQAVEKIPCLGTLSIAFIYLHNDNLDYAYIHRKTGKLLGKLIHIITNEEAK